MEAGEKTASAKAVAYLESQLDSIDDAYTMALTNYALELAGSGQSTAAHDKLMGMAKEDENGLHWGDIGVIADTGEQKVGRPGLMMPVENRTAAIETTAYALMALNLHKDNLDAGKAAKWLVAQRNAYGGYGSTQDTVVALEALYVHANAAAPLFLDKLGDFNDADQVLSARPKAALLNVEPCARNS